MVQYFSIEAVKPQVRRRKPHLPLHPSTTMILYYVARTHAVQKCACLLCTVYSTLVCSTSYIPVVVPIVYTHGVRFVSISFLFFFFFAFQILMVYRHHHHQRFLCPLLLPLQYYTVQQWDRMKFGSICGMMAEQCKQYKDFHLLQQILGLIKVRRAKNADTRVKFGNLRNVDNKRVRFWCGPPCIKKWAGRQTQLGRMKQ